MNRKVYFGNKQNQVWINAPQSGLEAGSQGFSAEQQLANGRSYVKRSRASHRRFSPSWIGSMNDSTLENSLQTVKDFADGIYGDGPFYWVDPYAQTSNMLPPHWAAPALTEKDWPAIWDFDPTDFSATDANNLSYPAKGVHYDISDTDAAASTRKLTIIVPEGYTLHFGWHGEVTTGTAGIKIDRYLRSTGLVESATPAALSVTSSNRTNLAISGSKYSFVEIYIYKASGAVDFSIAGMIAQIRKDGEVMESGPFLSGRGTTGIEFGGQVSIEYYSAAINNGQIGMSTQWIEV